MILTGGKLADLQVFATAFGLAHYESIRNYHLGQALIITN
jgi:hypothetical protein